MSQEVSELPELSPLQRSVLALKELRSRLDAERQAKFEPIAVIGMSCRFPGSANVDEFWTLLCQGRDAISEVPAERWDVGAYFDPDPDAPGKMYTKRGGFLGDVSGFDAEFFQISAREAQSLDPQQRLLLEVGWEALEDAGLCKERLLGSRTGVFVGLSSNDYLDLLPDAPEAMDNYFGTGTSSSVAAGRLSYIWGLQGPCLALDTACSSSLVAVHLACQALRNGECEAALVGGVNLILTPESSVYFSRIRALAPDGRCKTFDAKADGYARGEGCGVLVLKRLSAAERDGDRELAVIRGSAVNHDGRSNGLTAPNGLAQEAVIESALERSQVSPGMVSYVEAHGTGTSLGDPVEVAALGKVLAKDRAEGRRALLGSVKTNLGHLEAAAGVASLIKTILALRHRQIPAHLNFDEPSPFIDWSRLPLQVNQELTDWQPLGETRLAGVSSFGFGGTNAHVIVEEAPALPEDARASASSVATLGRWLLPVSAHHEAALRELAARYATALDAAEHVGDFCFSAGVRRSHHQERLVVLGSTKEDLVSRLIAFARGESSEQLVRGSGSPSTRPKLVYVFSPHGSQWAGMARDLVQTSPCFKASLERIEAALTPHVSWSLIDVLQGSSGDWLEQIDVLQPVLFALQLALAEWFRAAGVEPDAVVGHSMGEIAAACFAGVLSLEAAAQLICLRTRLLSRVTGEGAMAVVELSLARAREAIASHPGVFVAVSNSPRSTVLSGNTESLERVLDELTEAGVFCGWGVANVASHTPEMRSLAEELGRGIASLEPKSARLPLYSSVVGGACDGRDLTPAYWVRHLNDTVLFSRAVEALVHDGHTRFLELAPHPVLLPAIEDCLRQAGMAGQVLAALRREEPAATPLLEVLARLYVDGQPITYEMLYPKGRLLPLPAYPWQRERHWVEPAPAAPAKLASLVRLREYGHPLLRTHAFEAAHDAGTRVWELELSTREFAYLNDHRVQETVVLPATVYLELGLAAAQELFGPGSHGLEKFEFITPLVVADGDSRTLQIVVTPSSATRASIRFYAVEAATAETKRAFTLHAQGQLNLEGEWGTAETRGVPPEPDAASTQMPGSDYYSALGAQGLHYGPAFQGIQTLWHRPGEAVGKLRVREGVNAASGYCLHPALADAAFQVLGGVFGLAREAEQRTYLPAGVDQYRVFSALRVHPERELWVRVRLAPDSADGDAAIRADLELLELDGTRVLAVRGLLAKPLDRPRPDPAADWLLETSWQLRALPQVSRAAQAEAVGVAGSVDGAWLLFADRKGVAQAVARKLNARGGRSVLVWPGKAYRSIEPDRFEINPLELADYQRLLKDALPDLPLRGVVCLFHLSTGPQDPARQSDVLEAEALGAPALLQIVQALAKRGLRTPPRLWVVTEDAVPVCGADALSGVLQSPLWGFCRVVAQEHSEFACSRVDLPVPSAGSEPIDAATLALLVDELGAATAEDQIAFRGGERYVARLVRADPAGVQGRSWRKVREQPCRLEIDKPGMLDRLQLVPLEVRRPGPGEVEIRVAFTGLNFLDVLSAMGLRPGHVAGPLPLGFECSGQVVAVGDGVGELKPGDEVVAVAPWAFASHVITRHELVVKRPPGLSLEELATVPGCFMTAYAALVHEGRLQRGETVLIHSAASGTGQAAVQIALARGARVFATAGSEEKRAQLRQLGLAAVMDSRSLEFADEVLALTGGVGVDVVLNSLSGEAMLKSLSIVAPLGRFIEIGKKDVFEDARLALAPFRAGLTYSVLDIAALTEKRPERAGALLEEVVAQAADKTLVPLPRSVFPVSRVSDAFRFMASGRHTGKIVVAFDDENAQVSVPSKPGGRCKPDRTYLVTGGLGGLGLATARWLCEQGARHLVLVGRRAPSQAASQSVAELRAQGVEVTIEQVDVTSKEQTRSLIDRTQANLPPLAGIVHAAGVLDDSTLLQESAERLRTVCAPKLWGAVNICLGSHAASLDFLVLYSSGAALLGSPGQANYSAANSFLDAFAHYLRRRGVPALSINWGPFSDVGLVASPDFRQRFASRGLGTLTARQGMDMLGRLLGAEHAQIGVMPLNLRQWCQSNPKAAKSQVFEVLAAEGASSSAEAEGRTRDVLVGLPSRERADALNAHLRELLSRVLRTPEDRISYDAPFNTLGLDSLMALEFRNRLEVSLGLSLPATVVWAHPSARRLALHLLERLGLEVEQRGDASAVSESGLLESLAPGRSFETLSRINELSEEDVERLLGERLARKG